MQTKHALNRNIAHQAAERDLLLNIARVSEHGTLTVSNLEELSDGMMRINGLHTHLKIMIVGCPVSMQYMGACKEYIKRVIKYDVQFRNKIYVIVCLPPNEHMLTPESYICEFILDLEPLFKNETITRNPQTLLL